MWRRGSRFVRFQTGRVLSFQISWAEMNKREEVSVFSRKKAGGMIRRLFGADGLDETAIDDCELHVQEHGRSVNDRLSPSQMKTWAGFARPKFRSFDQWEDPLTHRTKPWP